MTIDTATWAKDFAAIRDDLPETITLRGHDFSVMVDDGTETASLLMAGDTADAAFEVKLLASDFAAVFPSPDKPQSMEAITRRGEVFKIRTASLSLDGVNYVLQCEAPGQ